MSSMTAGGVRAGPTFTLKTRSSPRTNPIIGQSMLARMEKRGLG